jgi:hypothetical protein
MITRQEAESELDTIRVIDNAFLAYKLVLNLCQRLIAALPAEAQEAACNPALTECPRCKNDISKCDSVFATITDARRAEVVVEALKRIIVTYERQFGPSGEDFPLIQEAIAMLAAAHSASAQQTGEKT